MTGNTDALHDPTTDRRGPATSLDFWFDYTCPWAYLGSTQAQALAARMKVPLAYRPFLLGGVFQAVGRPQNGADAMSPARMAYEEKDRARWAKKLGVPLTMPASHPQRSVEALRATIACGLDPAVIDGFYRAYWADGRAISSPDVIADVVERAGHDPAAIQAKIGTSEIKDELRKRTDDAIARGIFGAPTWIVDGAHLYWGQDRIPLVEGLRAPERTPPHANAASAASSASTRPKLEVFWDFSSPFAYLGVMQVDAIAARTGAEVVWRPMLLGGLFRTIGTVDVPVATFSPAKQRHVSQDLARWAAYAGVPFRFPSRFPIMTVKPLRLYLALPEEKRARFRDAAFRAIWADDRDIADEAVLVDCVGDEATLRAALARVDSPEVKGELRANTDEAAARGVFGAPSFFVGGELFWGQDRLALVEAALTRRA